MTRIPKDMLVLVLASLVPVLHIAHATGLRNVIAVFVALGALAFFIREGVRPPLAIAMGAWLLFATASSLWSSDAEATLKSVLTDIVMPAGGFYAAYVSTRQAQGWRLLCYGLLVGVAILAALTALAFIGGVVTALPSENRSGMIFYYPGPGVASTLCIFALPFTLLLSADTDRKLRWLGYVGLSLIAVAALGAMNRMFWLSAAIVCAVFYSWQWRNLTASQRRIAGSALLALVIAATSMVAYLSDLRGALDVPNRDGRLHAWREWVDIARAAPLVGHGFGKKTLARSVEDRLSTALVERDRNLRSHGHNILLDTVIQLGLLGLALFCSLLFVLGRQAHRARDRVHLRTGAALVALIAGMLAKNMTDDFMNHAVVIAFWTYAGMLLGALASNDHSLSSDTR